MMARRYRDFDAYWAEAKQEPLVVKVLGEEHELPPSPPAALVLRIYKLMAEGKSPEDELPAEEGFEIAKALFGEKLLNYWAEKGLRLDQLMDLVQWTIQQYASGAADEGKPLNRAQKRQAKRGGS